MFLRGIAIVFGGRRVMARIQARPVLKRKIPP
jgi:hypothetical protein